jgi:hypothetical protein
MLREKGGFRAKPFEGAILLAGVAARRIAKTGKRLDIYDGGITEILDEVLCRGIRIGGATIEWSSCFVPDYEMAFEDAAHASSGA